MSALSVVTFLLLGLSGAAPPEWALAVSRDGVDVFTSPWPGSRYKAFRGVTRIEASPDEVLRVLEDVPGYVSWFAFTRRASLLEETASGKTLYLETVFPWPFANEDMVYALTRTTADGVVRLALEGRPSARPRVDGVQRMRSATGFLEVRAVGSVTEVTYMMHTELGGNIPHWLANQNIHELPWQTLRNLRRLLERPGR